MKGETIRTFLIVTLVTLLVWLFAESRTLRAETLTVPVEISQGGRALVFRLTNESEWNSVVEVELSGPTGKLDQARGPLLDGVNLEFGVELSSDPGTRSVDLREALRRSDVLADSGVTVRRVIPESIEIQVDRLESVMVPVEVQLPGVDTTGAVNAEPPEVEVRLPAAFVKDLAVHAVAKVDPARLANLRPGRRTELSQVAVELTGLPQGIWGMRLVDPRVTVSLALRAETQNLLLPELPVFIEMTPADVAAWQVEIPPEDRVVSGVTLTGPGAAIDRIRRNEVRPRAVVSISTEDLEKGVERAPVEIVGLPPGVVADPAVRQVRVIAKRRPAEPAG
ncbi:MAG: hypothetical protein H6810_08760 [Phycisphaeraceae bacterium]|nr:MAG: hypothetical protein H6810_08760 [Phycisphaeraceae bacterium]